MRRANIGEMYKQIRTNDERDIIRATAKETERQIFEQSVNDTMTLKMLPGAKRKVQHISHNTILQFL